MPPMEPRRILAFGATSAIALETLRLCAKDGARMFLVGRDPAKLEAARRSLLAAGAEVSSRQADLLDSSGHASLIDDALAFLSGLDLILVAHGALGDRAPEHPAEIRRVIDTNFTSAVLLLNALIPALEKSPGACVAAISSVAGERGKKRNLVYNAAKGGFSIYLDGLRNRLFPFGVQVTNLKVGMAVTPMTAHLGRRAFNAAPERVARGIRRAIERRADEAYVPWFWRWIMLAVRGIPEPLFKRLEL